MKREKNAELTPEQRKAKLLKAAAAFVAVIFAIIGSLKSFDLIYILTKGGPLHATEVPTMLMYTEIFTSSRYGYASAMALLIIAECLIFTLLVQTIFGKISKRLD